MKLKKVVIATLTLMLCSLLLVGVARGGNPAYSITAYQAVAVATIDGVWTTADEWNDGPPTAMTNNARFTYNVDYATNTAQWLIENFGDTTNDAADYVRVCLDPDNSGGTFPELEDFRITIYGSGTIEVLQGGPVWLGDLGQGELVFAQSISASPWESAPHRIVELSDPNKLTGNIIFGNPPTGMHVEAYDATTQTLSVWAVSGAQDVPLSWGLIADVSYTPIPEGFGLVFLAVLSSFSVAVSFYFLRKHPKTKNFSLGKTNSTL